MQVNLFKILVRSHILFRTKNGIRLTGRHKLSVSSGSPILNISLIRNLDRKQTILSTIHGQITCNLRFLFACNLI